MKKNRNHKLITSTTSNATKSSSSEEKSIGTLIKEDFFRVIWSCIYLFIVGFIAYLIYSAVPFLFSYMYQSIGALIGMNYSKASNADLLYWCMICMSVGAIAVAFIIIILYKLFKWITNKIVTKHVLRK